MTEPSTLSSAHSTQILNLIESNPLSPSSWEELAQKVRGQNDPLSIKSLELIIEGLKRIEEATTLAQEQKMPPPQISALSKSMFVRLAKAYNSPTLLKEVGLIYLRDLGLPDIALQYFDRSLRLGGPEKELRPLSEASAVAVQRQLAQRSGHAAGHSGITTAQHAKPVAPTIIRKTGKLLMPSRFTQTTVTKIVVPEPEPEPVGPLPVTTSECLSEANIAISNGRLKRAEALLKKANEQPADNSIMWQAWTDLGQAYYDVGKPPKIEAAFLEALKYDPDELASHFNVALGYHLNNKYDLALAEYRKANQIDPKHPKVWCNLGVLYFQVDQYAQAESALRYATMSSPDYARAWDNLAASFGAQDKLGDALVACQRAISLRPDYPEAYFKMGVIYFSQNDLSRAASEFKRAAALPAITAYCESFIAMIHSRLEQTDAAEAAIFRAVRADPKCDLIWMAWNDLGLAWYSAGNYSRAANAYSEATVIKPDEPEAWFNLGVSFHQLGDLKSAHDSYQKAVKLKESLAAAWHNLGIIFAQTDDHEGAMNAFRQEVNWAPNNIRAWYDLGVTLEKLGRSEEARMAFTKADVLDHATNEISGAPGENSPDRAKTL